MEFFDLIQKRYSVRAYREDPVEREKLERILEAGRLAPTAANRQAFRILVSETRGREQEFRRLYDKDWFVQAPIILGVCSLPEASWARRDGKRFHEVDAAIVMDHMILAAADLGLGTCWVAAFDEQAAREIFRIPEDAVPVIFSPLGYPADRPRPKRRKSLDELVLWDGWSS